VLVAIFIELDAIDMVLAFPVNVKKTDPSVLILSFIDNVISVILEGIGDEYATDK
jgi:hypothetical protein